SEDGVKWTAVVNNTFEDKNILSIAFGGGKFVAVGMQGKMAYSIDGLTWTAVNDNTFSPYVILDIAYGNGKFIAIGGARQISASTDGITWTVVNNTLFAGGFAPLSFVTYGNRGFIIGRSNITCAACHPHMGHSTDGITWTGVPNDVFNLRGNGIFNAAYGDNKYIAIGGTGSGASPNSGKGIITQSADGINWTEVSARDVFGTEPIYAIAYGGGYFVAAGGEIGSDYNTIKGIGFSADGITWTAINSSAFTENDLVRNIAYGNGRFVIVGDAYTRVGNNPMRTWFGRIWYSDTIPVN
ncbi:MAG: hypothetical protein FWD13_06735, partial [Treponema sp.]|nr:hypothetical protein [Treponema sp.]